MAVILLDTKGPQRETPSLSVVRINGDRTMKVKNTTLGIEVVDHDSSNELSDENESDCSTLRNSERTAEEKAMINDDPRGLVNKLNEQSFFPVPGAKMLLYTPQTMKGVNFENVKAITYRPNYYGLLVSDLDKVDMYGISTADGEPLRVDLVVEVATTKMGWLCAPSFFLAPKYWNVHGRRKGNTIELFQSKDRKENPWLRRQLEERDFAKILPREVPIKHTDLYQSSIQSWIDIILHQKLKTFMRYGVFCIDEVTHRLHVVHYPEAKVKLLQDVLVYSYAQEDMFEYDDHDETTAATVAALLTAHPDLELPASHLVDEVECEKLKVIGLVEKGVCCLMVPPSRFDVMLTNTNRKDYRLYVNWGKGVKLSDAEQQAIRRHNVQMRVEYRHELLRKTPDSQQQTTKSQKKQANMALQALLHEEATAGLTEQQKAKRAEKSAARKAKRQSAKEQIRAIEPQPASEALEAHAGPAPVEGAPKRKGLSTAALEKKKAYQKRRKQEKGEVKRAEAQAEVPEPVMLSHAMSVLNRRIRLPNGRETVNVDLVFKTRAVLSRYPEWMAEIGVVIRSS